MKRIALAVVVGVVLLALRTVAPAAPSLAPGQSSPAALAAIAAIAPVVQSLDQQTALLKARLDNPPPPPQPARDPFHFGATAPPRSATPAPKPIAAPAPVVVEAPPPPALALPHLVAIISDPSDGGLMRTAVFDVGDDIRIIKPGEAIGKYTLRSIGVDVIELADPISGATILVALRAPAAL